MNGRPPLTGLSDIDPNARLGDASIPSPPDCLVRIGFAPALGSAEDAMIEAGGFVSVMVLNSEEDLLPRAHPERIIGLSREQGDEVAESGPPVRFDSDYAWLRIAHEGRARGSIRGQRGRREEGSRASLVSRAGAGRFVLYEDYRRRDRGEVALEAAKAALKDPRFAFRAEDVRGLGAGEALALRFRGTMTAGIQLRWSDIFASELVSLGKLLPGDATLRARARLSAYANVRVEATDDFVVVFSRSGSGGSEIRVSLRKANASGARGSARFPRFRVGLISEDELEDVAAQLARDLTGEGANQLNRTARAAESDALGEALEGFRDRAGAWAREALFAKSLAMLSFEYALTKSEEDLLEAQVNPAALGEGGFDRAHRALVRGDFAEIAARASDEKPVLGDGPGIKLLRFLRRTTRESERSWRVTLGVGRLEIGAANRSGVSERRVVDRLNRKHVLAFRGVRSYRSRWLGSAASWGATLAFRAVSAAEGGRENEDSRVSAEGSLYLFAEWREHHAAPLDVERALDGAVVYGVLNPKAAQSEFARLIDLAAGDPKLAFSLRFRLGPRALAYALGRICEMEEKEWADALGEAMPWLPDHPARRSPEARRAAYGPLWAELFGAARARSRSGRQSADASEWAKKAGRRMALVADQNLSRLEGDEGLVRRASFARTAQRHPRAVEAWSEFVRGARIARRAVLRGLEAGDSQNGELRGPRQAFRLMEPLFSQNLYMRALGAVLRDALREDPFQWEDVSRALQVVYADSEGERIAESIASPGR